MQQEKSEQERFMSNASRFFKNFKGTNVPSLATKVVHAGLTNVSKQG